MTLSRPHPRTLPIQRIRSSCRGRPIHYKVYDGLLLFGVCYRAATTKCLLSWNCAGVGVGPRHHRALVVLPPSSWSPANLYERRWRACRFLHARKRQARGGEGSSLVPGWCRQVSPRSRPHKYGSGDITRKQWGECASNERSSFGAPL